MKEYSLSSEERSYLMSVVINTKNEYLRKYCRRKNLLKIESIDCVPEIATYSDIEEVENKFYMDELLRIAKPYLTRKEMNVLKKAIENRDNFKEFKSYLKKHENYEYKILSKVLKKIGGIINE